MRFPLIFVASFVSTAVVAADAFDAPACQSTIPVEVSSAMLLQGDANDPAIRVYADSSETIIGDTATFRGQVRLTQGQRQIRTEEAHVNQSLNTFSATGGLVYNDAELVIAADSLTADIDNNEAMLSNARYWLNNQQVNGQAQELQISQEQNLILNNATFTTCAQPNPDWSIEAQRIEINSTTEWGEIWNAKVNVAGVPIFYLPYMTVPVTDKRKSGFLFPSISTSSKNGLDLAIPYYWNIAPNLDATFTLQYMSNRGLYYQTLGRYLVPWGQGQVNLEYMNKDQLFNNEERYLIHFEHQGRLDDHWRLYADFTTFSDDNYFTDLNSAVSSSSDNQINREAELSYFSERWDLALKVQDIEVLGDAPTPFQVLPRLTFNYYRNDLSGGLNFNFYNEITHFAHRDSYNLTATRWHLAPSLSLPYYHPAAEAVAEVELMQTFYQQDDPDGELARRVSRTLPQLRLHGKINLERDLNWGRGFLQTLEPQAQYLYVPYDDQSDIGLYDTALLQEDYQGLFRARRFSGLDRISDANQLTVGLASRILDTNLAEIGSLAVGQIFYFADPKVRLSSNASSEQQLVESNSALAAEGRWQINRNWYTQASLMFDTKSGKTNQSELLLNYQVDDDRVLQLSHRYVAELGRDEQNGFIDISQVGVRTTWPLNDELYFVGNYYYDTNLNRSIESYVGLQYESCCWAVQLSFYRELQPDFEGVDYNTISPSGEFDSGIRLNFVLKGLGSTGPIGVSQLRDEGQFSYRKPYYLRN
ncbi:MAG: LPS assembly protein LptD [Ferrimonas sp.]